MVILIDIKWNNELVLLDIEWLYCLMVYGCDYGRWFIVYAYGLGLILVSNSSPLLEDVNNIGIWLREVELWQCIMKLVIK